MTDREGAADFRQIRNATTDLQGLIECAILPLSDLVIFPHVITSLPLRNRRTRAAIQQALLKRKTLIGVLQRDPSARDVSLEQLYTIGTEIAPGRLLAGPPDQRTVLVEGRRRVEIVSLVQTEPYLVGRARLVQQTESDEDLSSQIQQAHTLFRTMVELNPVVPEEVIDHIVSMREPDVLADVIASTLAISAEDQQHLLEITDISKRLEAILEELGQELNVLQLQDEISLQVQQEMDRSQREVYLREQMRVIQSELGETDVFQQELDDVRRQIAGASLPSDIQERAMKELSRLAIMPPMAPEVGIIRTYIDWLTGLPWSRQSEDNLDVRHVQQILDSDHHGLTKVKDRILEYIAVRKLAASKMKSPVLCFVGPPGVGKTSLGKSIARALGREFVRVSLGGVRDEAEIRGHRRTYVGALPGRIIQTMRRAGTINPVFILDEIDKLGMDFRGDPASALLEVLDPEQNNTYSDHYLEVPYDLSHVLFITTANDLDPLPDALLDRLEVIEFSGYTEEEKIEIARKFLIPAQLETHGLANRRVNIEETALKTLIRDYTYEGGVRNLNREIANICRKMARMVAESRRLPRSIGARKVVELLGPQLYTRQRVHTQDSVGLATGLVWTYDGGDVSLIEVSVLAGKGNLTLTGQLGDVMQESAQAALSYLRARAADFNVPAEDFEDNDVHVHIPEGAVPKEGPSAGITLATAIISAFTERKVRSDFAMTGEITLRGKVLPVGGVKEKLLAARRAGIKNVILPRDNKKDLVDIPQEALNDLSIVFVNDMQQVINHVLLDPPRRRSRDEARRKVSKRTTTSRRKPIRKKKP